MESDKNRASQQLIQLEDDEGTRTAKSSVINTECVNQSLPSGTLKQKRGENIVEGATHNSKTVDEELSKLQSNHPKKTRADYQREYRQRIKAKQNPLQADKIENLKRKKAEYAKNLRARQKEMRQQNISTETEKTQQHDKREQEKKRKAANSKAYRERKKRLIDRSDTRNSEESTTTKIFAKPKPKSAAYLKAWRDKKKFEKYAAEVARMRQNQRARDENTNDDEIVQFVSQQSGENDQMQQRSTRIELESHACNQLQTLLNLSNCTL